MAEPSNGSKTLTGFQRWADFIRSTLALGLTIGGILWAVAVVSLDSRYAPKSLEAQVAQNGATAQAVQQDLKQLRIDVIQDQMFEARVRQCSATESSARQFYGQRLQQLAQRFRDIAGVLPPPLPPCGEIQ